MSRLRSRTRTLATTLLGVVATAALVIGAVAGVAVSGTQRAERERLLPGTRIGTVDVGGASVERAREQVTAHVADQLSAPITLRAEGEVVDEVSPVELGAAPDVAAAVRQARERSSDSRWRRVAAHVAPTMAGPHVDVPVEVDVDQTAMVVDALAERIERAPADATVSWRDGELVIEPGTPGRQLDREAATDRLVEATAARAEEIALPIATVKPDITEGDIAAVADELRDGVRQALDRTVTVHGDEGHWQVAAVDVGAAPDVEAALPRAMAAGEAATVDVPLTVDGDAVRARVEEIGADVETSARSARLATDDGWVDIVEGRPGRRLDRERAVARLTRAFAEGETDVDLPVGTVAPTRTRDDYRHVLLVRLNERRLYHYVDGEIAADWPVAVGGGDSPTPTGEYVVGRKRYRPTWVNPDPDGWGADMPRRIGPGRDNPLGLRALNWHRRDGGDTLIRFHGTAQTQSIGHAASQGCVRLTNDDVVELYERVPAGAAIVSVRG